MHNWESSKKKLKMNSKIPLEIKDLRTTIPPPTGLNIEIYIITLDLKEK